MSRHTERYYWLKSHGICVQCGCENAEKGILKCWRCRANAHDWNVAKRKPQSVEKRAEYAAFYRERYERRAEAGICTQCGIREAKPHKKCKVCRAKERQRYHKRNQKTQEHLPWDMRGNGLYCFRCCKPICSGQKVCEKCREDMAASADYARQFVDRYNHPFRKMDHYTFLKIRYDIKEK